MYDMNNNLNSERVDRKCLVDYISYTGQNLEMLLMGILVLLESRNPINVTFGFVRYSMILYLFIFIIYVYYLYLFKVFVFFFIENNMIMFPKLKTFRYLQRRINQFLIGYFKEICSENFMKI